MVDLDSLRSTLAKTDRAWLAISVFIFFLGQFAGIARWAILVPSHPALTYRFLANSYFVGCFFNTFLPTTIGGDVIRGYDLIKATGQWRESLASVLMDRLLGLTGFLLFALMAWAVYPPAREDPVIRSAFLGFCGVVLVTFAVLGSRRVLHAMLRPFGKIGLGALQSHTAQFQESLRAYLKQPQRLSRAFATTGVVQVLVILTFAAASKALGLPIPLYFLVLVVPIIAVVSQLPISLNGWGIREVMTIHFLDRIGVGRAEALALSLVCASIPLLAGAGGGIIFLLRKRKKPRLRRDISG